jgi:hypothetical protein
MGPGLNHEQAFTGIAFAHQHFILQQAPHHAMAGQSLELLGGEYGKEGNTAKSFNRIENCHRHHPKLRIPRAQAFLCRSSPDVPRSA